MKKLLLASAMMVAGSAAIADPFYLDIGTNYDGQIAPNGGKLCDTCTSMKDELLYKYDSETTILDTDGNGVDAGDLISTNGGLLTQNIATLSSNLVTNLDPAEVLGTNSNNGLNSDWFMTFSFVGLQGIVTDVANIGGNLVPQFAYGPGVIDLMITFDGVNYNNFMDIAIDGGIATGLSIVLDGRADFTNVDAGFNDLFHSGVADCAGDNSFYAIWSNCGEGAGEDLAIKFITSFDTNVLLSDFQPGPAPNTFVVSSNHDGSATFAVPEPSTLMLLSGAALMGGLARRRKAKA